jgi:hypothetical protein
MSPVAAEVRVLFAPLEAEVSSEVRSDQRERPWTETRETETDWHIEGRLPLTGSLDLSVGWYGISEEHDNVMLGCIPAASNRELTGLCIRQSANWSEFSAQGVSVSVEQQVRLGGIDFFGRFSVMELDVQTRERFAMQSNHWRRRIALFGGGARWYPTERNWGLQAVATRSLERETVLSAGFFVGF